MIEQRFWTFERFAF